MFRRATVLQMASDGTASITGFTSTQIHLHVVCHKYQRNIGHDVRTATSADVVSTMACTSHSLQQKKVATEASIGTVYGTVPGGDARIVSRKKIEFSRKNTANDNAKRHQLRNTIP